ncbi:MAG: hypothetical protein Q9221_002104 [Calogaya cf. arnoldii]
MKEFCMKIIKDRDEHLKPDAKDLLNVVLNGVDKNTGEKRGVDNVMYQIPTLLGCGYETSGATLCFVYYFLCNNIDKLAKAQQEVDEIVGFKVLTYGMLRNLKYLDACMKESLRLQHPIRQMVSGIWRHFHRDPKVWGEDADEFRPARMLDVNFMELPPISWKPFVVKEVDPNYEMTLTGQMGVKPVGAKIRVVHRVDRTLNDGILGGGKTQELKNTHHAQQKAQRQQQN